MDGSARQVVAQEPGKAAQAALPGCRRSAGTGRAAAQSTSQQRPGLANQRACGA